MLKIEKFSVTQILREIIFGRVQYSKYVLTLDAFGLDSARLISRKIWMTEKFSNFVTVFEMSMSSCFFLCNSFSIVNVFYLFNAFIKIGETGMTCFYVKKKIDVLKEKKIVKLCVYHDFFIFSRRKEMATKNEGINLKKDERS